MWVQRSRGHQRDRLVRVPTFHQHRGRAQQQRAFERVDGSADVGDRRRDQKLVAGLDQPVIAELADQCVDRIMAVQNAFRPACGARGVEDHPHRVGVRAAGIASPSREFRSSSDAYAVWSPVVAAHHHDLGRRVHLGGDPVQHRGVVVLAERRAARRSPGCRRRIEDELQLAIPQRRQDRVDRPSRPAWPPR